MKLTRASSYALHALAYMATQKSEKPVPSHLIARDRGIPERFLLKVLKPLVSTRVLNSIKGPNGGYKLMKDPFKVSLCTSSKLLMAQFVALPHLLKMLVAP